MPQEMNVLRADARQLSKLVISMVMAGRLLSDINPESPIERIGDEDQISTRSEAFGAGIFFTLEQLEDHDLYAMLLFASRVVDVAVVLAAMKAIDGDGQLFEFIRGSFAELNDIENPTIFPRNLDLQPFIDYLATINDVTESE